MEIERIYQKAKKKLDDEERRHNIPPLPEPGESEDKMKKLTPSNHRPIIQESEDEDNHLEGTNMQLPDKEDKLLFNNKRLRSQLSEEEHERQMPNALGRYLKKHNTATGGENPETNV